MKPKFAQMVVLSLVELGASAYVGYLVLPETDRIMMQMRILRGSAHAARRIALTFGLLAIRFEHAYGKVSANG